MDRRALSAQGRPFSARRPGPDRRYLIAGVGPAPASAGRLVRRPVSSAICNRQSARRRDGPSRGFPCARGHLCQLRYAVPPPTTPARNLHITEGLVTSRVCAQYVMRLSRDRDRRSLAAEGRLEQPAGLSSVAAGYPPVPSRRGFG